MRVLVVEDEPDLLASLLQAVREDGYAADGAGDGVEGFYKAETFEYDAVVLDIMLPGKDGLSILRNLRERKMGVPVIVLTARSELNERLEGLNLGADDYLTKPFFIEELIARVHAVARRAAGTSQSILVVEDLTVNLLTREVVRSGRQIELTAREFALLESLMRSPGRVLTRAQICEQVWDYNFDPGTNLVEVYVQRLRKKVDEGATVKRIETVRGVGYRMKPAS